VRALPEPEEVSEREWRLVDDAIRAAWDGLRVRATEAEPHQAGAASGLRFLPYPYFAPFVEGERAMFAWTATS
jgi:hypothetical protein